MVTHLILTNKSSCHLLGLYYAPGTLHMFSLNARYDHEP